MSGWDGKMMYMHMYVHMFKLAFAFIHTCMTMYMSKFICIIQFIPLFISVSFNYTYLSLFNMYVYEVLHVYALYDVYNVQSCCSLKPLNWIKWPELN